MIEKVLEKINYALGIFCIGVLLGLVVFLTNIEIRGFDLWLHLKTGEFIVSNLFIPTTDIFSCTAFGQIWHNHEWLFQVILNFVFSHWGFDGLSSMQSIVVVCTFMVLVFLGDIRKRQLTTIFLLLFVVFAYQSRFTIRPDIFSLFFLVLYMYFLTFYLSRKWTAGVLVVIQILWVNIHGFFILGPGIVFLLLFSEAIKRKVKLPWNWNVQDRLDSQEFKNLCIIFASTFLACLANPQFVSGLIYPFQILFQMTGSSGIFFNNIQELESPLSNSIFFSGKYLHYKILVLFSALSFIVNYRKVNLFHLLLWGIFLGLSLKALRNTISFCVVAYWVSFCNIQNFKFLQISIFFKNKRKLKLIGLLLAKIVFIIWIFNFAYETAESRYYDFKNYKMKSIFWGISSRNFPSQAVDFLNRNNIKGNFFNDFNSGSYLIGNCFPRIKVFIDGRTEFYGPDFFKQYQEIFDSGNKKIFDKVVNQHDLTGVFLSFAFQDIPKKIVKEIYNDPQWILIYLDYDAAIFLRDVPKNKGLINRLELSPEAMPFLKVDMLKLGLSKVSPYQQIKRARILEAINLDSLALEQVEEALLISPSHVGPYLIRGKIYLKQEKYKEAFESLRIASMGLPTNTEVRYYLALAYEKLGSLTKAGRQYRWIFRRDRNNKKSIFGLCRIYLFEGKGEKSLKLLSQVNDFSEADIEYLFEIGDFLFKEKKLEEAKKVYSLILEVNPTLKKASDKIDRCTTS